MIQAQHTEEHKLKLSTIDFDQAKKSLQGPFKEKKIQSFSLDEVFKFSNLENKKVDLLDIDVEGVDFKVLKGL